MPAAERRVAQPRAPSELVGAERPEAERQLPVVGTHLAALVHELVEEALVLIAPEQRGHGPARYVGPVSALFRVFVTVRR